MGEFAGDFDDGGPGILMRDNDWFNTAQPHYYFLYENGLDERPWKYTRIYPGVETWISVCPTFAGRIDKNSSRSWGDISLLEGCDGTAVLRATDGSGVTTGFSRDILSDAPKEALGRKSDGMNRVLDKTVGPDGNPHALEWELGLLDPGTEAYIIQTLKPVIVTKNGRWDLTLYFGTF
ncbi:hypothetical protein QBC38DRAFT_521538 [Podospora fimiseda]|uniref:Uncharacterized protein n=1 Tax=Podospora fimiseda TaxID=252190 RepID=A0AAN7H655_9PEZI|nr:hypothetical protein QBC38DRAFT_521538 [Podospora fimiseda]